MENIFEKATKAHVRFAAGAGEITTEDLWHLSLTAPKGTPNLSLDTLARALHKQLTNTEVSFVNPEATKDEILELKFEVVKRVIEVRLEEIEKAKKAAERKAEKSRILEIMQEKEDEELKGKSMKELKKLLNNL